MSQWFVKIFGIDMPGKGQLSDIAFHLIKPWPLVLAMLGLLAIIVGVTVMYRRVRRPLAPWLLWTLTGLRMGAMILLLLLIFEPIAQVEYAVEKRPRFIVLVDNSQSMEFKDQAQGRRLDLVNKLLADKKLNLLPTLREKYDLDLWTFGSEVRQVETPATTPQQEAKPPVIEVDKAKGQTTRIGDALTQAFAKLKGEMVPGVILISDGQSNTGEDPTAAAYLLKNNDVKVFSVGVGDPISPKDVRLLEPLAPEEAFLADPVEVQVDVSHTGYSNREVEVKVMKGSEVLGKERILLGADREKQRVKIRFASGESGMHDYAVKVTEQPEEISLENNVRIFRMNVKEDKLRVLYVEGKPNRLYRFFKNALYREPTIHFSVLLQSAPPSIEEAKGMAPLKGFPNLKDHLVDNYDILILGDIKKGTLIRDKQFEFIRDFVGNAGKGFLHIADFVHEGSPASFKGNKVMEDILPVELEGATKEGIPYKGKKGFQMELTPFGFHDSLMRIKKDPEENRKYWQDIFFTWCARVGPAKKTSTVLASNPDQKLPGGDPLPLIVQGRYGAGKTMYIGINDLWRLRYGYEDEFFWGGFFRPLLHWLSPSKGAGKTVDLRTDKTKYAGGEKVRIYAALNMKGMVKLTKATDVKAKIAHEGGEFEEVSLTEDADGMYVGAWVPEKTGKYAVSILQAPGLGEPIGFTKAPFFVEIPNLEMEHPEMNEGVMKQLAEVTGGKYFHISKAGDLTKEIVESKKRVTLTIQKELHDTPLAALMLIAMFATEWWLRRRRGLA